MALAEVEDCNSVDALLHEVPLATNASTASSCDNNDCDDAAAALLNGYLQQGTDTATGQDVALLTRYDHSCCYAFAVCVTLVYGTPHGQCCDVCCNVANWCCMRHGLILLSALSTHHSGQAAARQLGHCAALCGHHAAMCAARLQAGACSLPNMTHSRHINLLRLNQAAARASLLFYWTATCKQQQLKNAVMAVITHMANFGRSYTATAGWSLNDL